MKTYHLIIMAILLMASHHIFAQNRQDTLGIKKACMDYIEGHILFRLPVPGKI